MLVLSVGGWKTYFIISLRHCYSSGDILEFIKEQLLIEMTKMRLNCTVSEMLRFGCWIGGRWWKLPDFFCARTFYLEFFCKDVGLLSRKTNFNLLKVIIMAEQGLICHSDTQQGFQKCSLLQTGCRLRSYIVTCWCAQRETEELKKVFKGPTPFFTAQILFCVFFKQVYSVGQTQFIFRLWDGWPWQTHAAE